ASLRTSRPPDLSTWGDWETPNLSRLVPPLCPCYDFRRSHEHAWPVRPTIRCKDAPMPTFSVSLPETWLRLRWVGVALCAFFIILGVQYSLKILGSERDNRSAILRWRPQILELNQGENIWET